MKTRAGTFLLIIVGIVLAFLIAELLVRVFLPQDKMVTWIEMHPRGFMMNQPNIVAADQFGDRKLHYHLIENGLRGREPVQPDNPKILLLGDSFTFGLLLNQEDTYAQLLQDSIDVQFPEQNIQLLNAGVGGAGLADWPAWLEHKGESISPDMVILFLNYMDVDRALSKNLYVVKDSELINSIRWKPRKFFMSLGRKEWYRWLQEHSEVMNILVKIAWRYLYFSDQTDNFSQQNSEVPVPPADAFDVESGYSLTLAQKLMDRIVSWCDQHNSTLVIATTGFFEKNSTGVHTYAYYESLLQDFTAVPSFFDITPCFKAEVNGDYASIRIPNNSHPDERGAEIIADCSWDWLGPFLEQQMSAP